MNDTHLNMLVNLLTQQNAEQSEKAKQSRDALMSIVGGVRRALLDTLYHLDEVEGEHNGVDQARLRIRQVLIAMHSYATLYDIPNSLPRDYQQEPNAHIPACECCHRANRACFGLDGELLINQAPQK